MIKLSFIISMSNKFQFFCDLILTQEQDTVKKVQYFLLLIYRFLSLFPSKNKKNVSNLNFLILFFLLDQS